MRTVRISASLAVYDNGGRAKAAREGRCRMCLHPRRRRGVRRLTRHHLVPRAWFVVNGLPYRLRDAEFNLVPLCERCHRDVETDGAARAMLRKVLTQQEVAFAIQVRGTAWFAERYPLLGRKQAAAAQAA